VSARFATSHRFHSRAFVPSCGRLVRRHPWCRPELRRAARFRPVPSLACVNHPYAYAHPSARLRMHVARLLTREGTRANTSAASPSPRPRRCRTHRDGHQLPSLRPSSPATQGNPSSRPVLARRPGAVGLVAGEVFPRRHLPCRHLIEHLGSQSQAQDWAVHGWPHAGVAIANPPGSAAASHSRPRPHARLHRAGPHGTQPDPMRRPMAGRPRVGRRGAKPHPRSGDPVRLGPIRGGF
jgi:hypothetical protein